MDSNKTKKKRIPKKKIKRRSDSFLKDALVLCAITLVAGGLLALVYNVTVNPIEKAAKDTETKSYVEVFAEGKTFTEDPALTKKMEEFNKTADGTELKRIKVAKDESGKEIGHVLLVNAKEGYGGTIQFSIGLSEDNTIQGVKVLIMSETAGLGAKCTEDTFQKQFKGKKGNEITLIKGKAKGDSEISAISGATITSKAITKALNQTLKFMSGLKG